MSKKEVKTNAMRILDRQKIPYEYEEYECGDFIDGIQVADQLGYDHALVYKTLVTTGKSGQHYVFVIPIERPDQSDRLCAGRMYGNRHEEAVSYGYPGGCMRPGLYPRKRRKAGHTAKIKPPTP